MFLSGNLKFSVVSLKWHAYFRTEVQNLCMDGGAAICNCCVAAILGTLCTISLCTRPKHYCQHSKEVHED